jgi:hypothetical protein
VSTDLNTEQMKVIHQAASHGGEGFVKFSQEAWKAWDDAIGAFIADIDDKVKPDLQKIRETYKPNVSDYQSALDAREMLRDNASNDIEASVNDYRAYLVEMRETIKAAYDRLNNVDQS